MRILFCFVCIAISAIKNVFMAQLPYLDVYRNNYKIEEYTISLESNYTKDYIGYVIFGKIKSPLTFAEKMPVTFSKTKNLGLK